MQTTSKAVVNESNLQNFLKSGINVHFTNRRWLWYIISVKDNEPMIFVPGFVLTHNETSKSIDSMT